MNMATWFPSGKVTAGGIVAIAVLVVITILNEYVLTSKPIGTELAMLCEGLGYFIGSYFKSPTDADVAVVKGA